MLNFPSQSSILFLLPPSLHDVAGIFHRTPRWFSSFPLSSIRSLPFSSLFLTLGLVAGMLTAAMGGADPPSHSPLVFSLSLTTGGGRIKSPAPASSSLSGTSALGAPWEKKEKRKEGGSERVSGGWGEREAIETKCAGRARRRERSDGEEWIWEILVKD